MMTAVMCAEIGCMTRLSRYNPEPYCFVHALPQWGDHQRVEPRARRRHVEELAGLHPEDLEHEGTANRRTAHDVGGSARR
jgi:hypothetical protein